MKVPHFNVAIVGSGITGLSTAYHLKKQGTDKIVLIQNSDIPSFSTHSANILAGGLTDNFTRISNAHGLDFAAELWSFSNFGYDKVIEFCQTHKVPYKANRRIRLIVNDSEFKEAEQAVKQLQSVNLEGTLNDPNLYTHLQGFEQRVLAVQDDGPRGAWVDTSKLLHALHAESDVIDISSALHSFEKTRDGITLNLADGSEITAEFIVLACHQQIANFLPVLKDALVTYADQWSDVHVPNLPKHHKGVVFSAHHGYEWGLILDTSLHYGGGRYLRKMAGIGAKEAPVMQNITDHLHEHLTKTFQWAKNAKFQNSKGLIEIWPCDELPVIGPMFGEERILLATGYMGTGMSLGFQAGLCLSDLIRTGECQSLPRRLWPERLRSL